MSTRTPASAEHASRAAIGQRVKDLRQRRGMTLRNLASGLMVSSATVSAIENGHTGLSAVRLGEVAALLGVSVEELDASPSGSSPGSWRSGAMTPDSEDSKTNGLEVTAVLPVVRPFDWRHYPPLVLDPPLAAALSSFLDLGYHGATMRHIAQRAGLSVPGIYHYYPSKREMLVAILDLTMDDLIRRSSAARDQGVGPVERFTLLVECLALYHTPSPRAGVRRGERDTQPSSPAARAGGRHPARAAAHGRRRGSGRGSKRRLPHRTPPRSGSGGCHDAHRAPAVVLRGGTDQRRGCRAPVCGVRPGPGPLPALPEWAACRRTKQLVSMGPLSTRPAR